MEAMPKTAGSTCRRSSWFSTKFAPRCSTITSIRPVPPRTAAPTTYALLDVGGVVPCVNLCIAHSTSHSIWRGRRRLQRFVTSAWVARRVPPLPLGAMGVLSIGVCGGEERTTSAKSSKQQQEVDRFDSIFAWSCDGDFAAAVVFAALHTFVTFFFGRGKGEKKGEKEKGKGTKRKPLSLIRFILLFNQSCYVHTSFKKKIN